MGSQGIAPNSGFLPLLCDIKIASVPSSIKKERHTWPPKDQRIMATVTYDPWKISLIHKNYDLFGVDLSARLQRSSVVNLAIFFCKCWLLIWISLIVLTQFKSCPVERGKFFSVHTRSGALKLLDILSTSIFWILEFHGYGRSASFIQCCCKDGLGQCFCLLVPSAHYQLYWCDFSDIFFWNSGPVIWQKLMECRWLLKGQ